MANGTAALTVTAVGSGTNALMCVIAWTADGSGNVNGNTLALPAGTILKVEFVPSATTPPINLYDVNLLSTSGVSQFDDGTGTSIGANLSSTVAVQKAPFVPGASTTYVRNWLRGAAGGNIYQLTVTGAGAGGAGLVNMFISPQAV